MKYLTKAEVAVLLRVSVRTVSEYRNRGLLPVPSRLGRKLLWDEAELIHAVSLACTERLGTARRFAARGRPRKVTFP
jgi:predicted DNA-binding transcriptional regulator AlpA